MTTLLTLLALTVAANAEESPAPLKLDHCKPRVNLNGGAPQALLYELTPTGSLSVDTKHPSVQSFERKPDGTETVILRATDPLAPGLSMRQTVQLRKAEGRPDTIEQTVDKVKERKLWFNSVTQQMPTMGQRFQYDKDGTCRIKQVYFKDKAGKEHVAYDRELCAELLPAAKKLDKNKLKECQDVFGTMWRAIQKAATRLKAEGKELTTELGFMFPHASAGSADQSFTHMLVASRCQATLAMFGEGESPEALTRDLGPANPDEIPTSTEVETAQ